MKGKFYSKRATAGPQNKDPPANKRNYIKTSGYLHHTFQSIPFNLVLFRNKKNEVILMLSTTSIARRRLPLKILSLRSFHIAHKVVKTIPLKMYLECFDVACKLAIFKKSDTSKAKMGGRRHQDSTRDQISAVKTQPVNKWFVVSNSKSQRLHKLLGNVTPRLHSSTLVAIRLSIALHTIILHFRGTHLFHFI